MEKIDWLGTVVKFQDIMNLAKFTEGKTCLGFYHSSKYIPEWSRERLLAKRYNLSQRWRQWICTSSPSAFLGMPASRQNSSLLWKAFTINRLMNIFRCSLRRSIFSMVTWESVICISVQFPSAVLVLINCLVALITSLIQCWEGTSTCSTAAAQVSCHWFKWDIRSHQMKC